MFVPIKLVIKMEKQKYLDKFSPIRYVFIRTDCNRQHFSVGIAESLQQIKNTCYADRQQWSHQPGQMPRLVYYEEVPQGYAFQRYSQLQHFTSSQMGRLIRSINQNWKDLHLTLESSDSYYVRQ